MISHVLMFWSASYCSLLVTNEICADGRQRVVGRCLSTKTHSMDAASPQTPILEQKMTSSTIACGKAVYNSILNHLSALSLAS